MTAHPTMFMLHFFMFLCYVLRLPFCFAHLRDIYFLTASTLCFRAGQPVKNVMRASHASRGEGTEEGAKHELQQFNSASKCKYNFGFLPVESTGKRRKDGGQ
jgi:hypothetical protein